MEKKVLRRIAAMMLSCVMLCSMTACTTTLNGTYNNTEGLIDQSFTFQKDNRVEMSAFGIEIEGDYLIEDGVITISYDLLGLNYTLEKSFEKDGSSIFIDGVEFVKEK